MSDHPQTSLVCTLGGQPQIVTFTLDALLQRGEAMDEVFVVYMAANPRYRQAYQRLADEFAGGRYAGRPCRLHGEAVRLGDQALAEARQPAEVDAVWQTFYRLLGGLKAQNRHVHLSLTGGRRVMALLACAVAPLLLTPGDKIWHLHTPEEVITLAQEGAMMHTPPETGVHLIEVPLVAWGSYFPGVRGLLGRSPQEARAVHLGLLDENERARCRQVWEQINPRQRDALRALCEHPTRELAAKELYISVGTLDDHKTEILRRCRQAWQVEAGQKLDVVFLRQKFKPFLALLNEG